MKISDYISKTIQEYHTLYKDVDYEQSKLKVLNHIFFVIGNGLELADTENPAEGGYVVDPIYERDNDDDDEFIRINDEPYGEIKYGKIPDGYFESGSTNSYPFSPYPISKKYSIVCNVLYDNVFLQDDWMAELVILCRRALEYYTDESQFKNNLYYPSDVRIRIEVADFQRKMKKSGIEEVIKLREIWGYEPNDSVPEYSEVESRKIQIWNTFHKEQISILTEFLEKFGNK